LDSCSGCSGHGHLISFIKVSDSFLSSFFKGESILADSGTEQLEFIALSQRTGDPKYQQKVCNFSIPYIQFFGGEGFTFF
jgi:hypothetical protein